MFIIHWWTLDRSVSPHLSQILPHILDHTRLKDLFNWWRWWQNYNRILDRWWRICKGFFSPNSKLVGIYALIPFDLCLISWSCLIDEGQTFLLTGSLFEGNRRIASRYNSSGWIEHLSDLNVDRWNHGCLQYTNNFGAKVKYFYTLVEECRKIITNQ